MDNKQILEWLEQNLDNERYEHSLGVAETAKMLAEKYGENPDKAYLAGLIHDCAKCFGNDKNNEFIKLCNIDLEPQEKNNKKTLHAPLGCYTAKNVFDIDDEEILSAIRWHTLGKKNMTLFEKIIFLADKIEHRTRPKDFTDRIEAKLNKDNGLDLAILECFKLTISSLTEREIVICTHTIDIYNDLIEKYKK